MSNDKVQISNEFQSSNAKKLVVNREFLTLNHLTLI